MVEHKNWEYDGLLGFSMMMKARKIRDTACVYACLRKDMGQSAVLYENHWHKLRCMGTLVSGFGAIAFINVPRHTRRCIMVRLETCLVLAQT